MGLTQFITYGLDDTFEFPFNTHSLDTGNLSDADTAPTFRVYAVGADEPVMSGTCSKKDDANTVGFYVARGELTEAAGFAEGSDYEVRVEATVGGVTQAEVIGVMRIASPGDAGGPESGELCRLYAYMYYVDGVNAGKPVGAGLGTLEVTDLLTRPSGIAVIYGESGTVGLTDENGYAGVDVVRGARVRLRATWPVVRDDGSAAIQQAFADVTVPDEPTLDVGPFFQS